MSNLIEGITMKLLNTLLLLTLALTANIASADHGEGCKNMQKMDFSMKGMDTNKDGTISSAEYMAANQDQTTDNFKHMDANNDGKLDTKEQKDIEEVMKEMHNPKAKTPVSTM